MGQNQRQMPVRADRWHPVDPIFDNIIRRCVRNAENYEAGNGNSEYMAGAIILGLIFVIILVVAGSVQAAIVVPIVIAVGALIYVAANSGPSEKDRRDALAVIGGPGRLPAGYLVSTDAWDAGLAEHVAAVPESQLQAAAHLCDKFRGTVDDLLSFTAAVASQVNAARHHAAPLDMERRVGELVRIGAPILAEHNAKNPPPSLEAGKSKAKKSKK